MNFGAMNEAYPLPLTLNKREAIRALFDSSVCTTIEFARQYILISWGSTPDDVFGTEIFLLTESVL